MLQRIPYLIVTAMLATSGALANEVMSYGDILANGPKYINKSVALEGSFLFSEPMRESFTIDQKGNLIEVFYRDLPGSDKALILSLPENSKAIMIVSGTLKQYTNNRSYFIDATSMRLETGSLPIPTGLTPVSYGDIQSAPAKYLKKRIMMKGTFVYSEPMRQSFSFDQGGNVIEVLISDLSKTDREAVFAQKKNSRAGVTVTGELLSYVNNPKKYYITADSIMLGN
jgi:hypothetical protein